MDISSLFKNFLTRLFQLDGVNGVSRDDVRYGVLPVLDPVRRCKQGLNPFNRP